MPRLAGVVAAFGLVVATACAGGSPGTLGRAEIADMEIDFEVTAFSVGSPSEPRAGAADGALAGAVATLDRWLGDYVIASLQSGQPVSDLGPLFTPAAAEQIATSADGAAFAPEGLPPVVGLDGVTTTLEVTALGDTNGEIPLVAANVDLELHGQAGGALVAYESAGHVVLVAGDSGWLIDSYDVTTVQQSPRGTATTTAAS